MKRPTSTIILVGGLLAASGALAGCTSDSEPTAPVTVTVTATPEASVPASAAPSGSPAPDASVGLPLTADTAIDAALSKVPGGAVVAGDRTDEAGQQVWSVEVRGTDGAGTELYLNVDTGAVVRERPTSLSSEASGTLPALSAQEGIAAAVQAVPGSEVLEFDLETEQGTKAWYVLVRDASGLIEVYVNADTGAIISQERDD
ncbi:MAG: PepSY domain-containing protein [Candidatus Nanopelagicales bacterium]